jgi:hypothetical protein
MQSTQLDMFETNNQQSSSGRMFQESLTPQTTHLDAFSENLPESIVSFSRQGEGGQTRVWCMAPSEQSRGESWMPNISAWHNAGEGCLLSQVLEKGSIHPRFFLSSQAKEGILRRAEKRGKELPPMLKQALSGPQT